MGKQSRRAARRNIGDSAQLNREHLRTTWEAAREQTERMNDGRLYEYVLAVRAITTDRAQLETLGVGWHVADDLSTEVVRALGRQKLLATWGYEDFFGMRRGIVHALHLVISGEVPWAEGEAFPLGQCTEVYLDEMEQAGRDVDDEEYVAFVQRLRTTPFPRPDAS